MLDSYTLLGALATQTSRCAARHNGHRCHVPQPGPPGQDRDDTRHHQRGTGHPRYRGGVVRRGARRLGLRPPPGRERLDRLEEALQICRAMFTDQAPTFDGRDYRIHEARNVPPPLQPGGPPILIGGGGEKRTLQLVARYADMSNIFGDAATVAHKVEVLRRHCEAIGRDPSEVTVSRLSTLVLTDSAEETASTRDFLRQVTGEEPTTSDMGTPDELVARVEELAAVGVQYFIFNMPTGSPDTVRRVGELLISRFGD